ncbi:unnamed protein product [Ilex paraguariensis]|uniref:Protein kinase domain-containing protein n=1 Tax=Ilex paraguariensis TaxID=185542 RepID=A0ABC8TPS4_9AQUA
MQVVNSGEKVISQEDRSNEPEEGEKVEDLKPNSGENNPKNIDDESVIDVSGRSLDFPVLEGTENSIEGLYIYKNVFNLIPRAVGGFGRLKTLKFFANEVNLVPPGFRNLVELECLHVKVSLPGLSDLNLGRLKGLKELELSRVPPRPSAFPILGEIAGLKCLTKLSVCHFSIRYLPPEIGCLNNLEYLDLSFNKMRSLPSEVTHLNALKLLKVANNKLVELPSALSSLQKLESLDLSNNKLTSLGSLELGSMHNLQRLYLQFNNLRSCCQVPSWISCDLEGNGKDTSNDEFISSSVEMDVYEGAIQEIHDSARISSPITLSSHLSGASSNSRCMASRRSKKGWKRQYYFQQRARLERLNSSRKWKGDNHAEASTADESEKCKRCKHAILASDSPAEGLSDVVGPSNDSEELLSGGDESGNLLPDGEEDKKGYHVQKCSCVVLDSVGIAKEGESDCTKHHASLDSLSSDCGGKEEGSSSEVSNTNLKSKRHLDRDLDNPKPSKSRRPSDFQLDISCKYSNTSFCSIEDLLPDGFYDAGRDRPFLPLMSYEQNWQFDSREVILVDRERDEELDAISLCAQALVFHFKQINGSTNKRGEDTSDNLQVASLLALFVSDHFGGSDKSAVVERTRKAVSGSNYRKPFVCTCPTGNSESVPKSTKRSSDTEDIFFLGLCEKSLQTIKARRNSIVVPIGTLQFGVCRHRALLMKYLCDWMVPRIPCELVRGYLDFSPHAWNVISVQKGNSWVRMIVDACRPHDIREETDPEYFCRYVPLSRINGALMTDSEFSSGRTFPSLSECDEIGKAAPSTLIQCKFGALEAVAKVHTMEGCGTSADEIKNFEFNCLAEVRILSALKHPCIVEIYGHQISSNWALSLDGKPEHRLLQSAIFMEYIKGGSLKNYVEKLSRAGEKHVPVELLLCIARNVACALAELHSKHIIHRDIKSENILIDLDKKKSDGTPVVKLCDFDKSVPLRSCLHTCCIAHLGIPPPDMCVGTPRWMAPEVFRAMHNRNVYGLEVDIWSFGCVLLELLTLQVPYSGLPDSDIHDLLQMGKRPQLTDELEALGQSGTELEDPAMAQSGTQLQGPEAELGTLKFLVDLYHRCTEENPANRPTAENLYNTLLAHASSVTGSNLDQE